MVKSGSSVQVINRAAQILRQLKRADRGQSLGEIALGTGLPRSTVQRIVDTLNAEGFIATSGKNGDLRLGPEIQSLAMAAHIDVPSLLRPALEVLSEKICETVDLACYRKGRMIIVDQVIGLQRLCAVSVPGHDFPLTNTANGKAILALLPDHKIKDICDNIKLARNFGDFIEEIERVRETGVAYDIDEHTQGISAVGIAFQTASCEFYAVSVPAPSQRFDQNRTDFELALKEFVATSIFTNPYFH